MSTDIEAVYGEALRDAETANDSPGDAYVSAIISGRSRWLHHMLTGTLGTECNVNPQGLIGVDWSGPPYGPAQRHNVWHYAAPTSTALNNWSETSRSFQVGRDGLACRFRGAFWVRPFPAHVPLTPYSRLYYSGVFDSVGVNGTMTWTWNVNGVVTEDTSSITTSTSYLIDEGYVTVKPGWNTFTLDLGEGTAGDYDVLAVSLNQVKKLTH